MLAYNANRFRDQLEFPNVSQFITETKIYISADLFCLWYQYADKPTRSLYQLWNELGPNHALASTVWGGIIE